MSRLILFIDPIWDCPLLCEEDHWSCTASDHLYSCKTTRHVGDCPVCFGPWGAWRAVLWLVMPNAETIAGLTCAAEADRCNLLSMLGLVGFRLETQIFLDAVGWSP